MAVKSRVRGHRGIARLTFAALADDHLNIIIINLMNQHVKLYSRWE